MSDIAADVIAIVARRLPSKEQGIQLTDRLADLGIDSFAAIEMIFDLEERFDIQISYNSNDAKPEFETVGDVVGAIERLVVGKA